MLNSESTYTLISNLTVKLARHKKRQQSEASTDDEEDQTLTVPLPERRSQKEKQPIRKKVKIDVRIAMESLEAAFKKRLTERVEGHAKELGKKQPKLEDDQLTSKFAELKKELQGAARMPRGILTWLRELGEHPPRSITTTPNGHDLVEKWTAFV